MFGRKCSLCGGKLDSNHICTECGLDNTKSDGNYSRNHEPEKYDELTHVHRSGQTHSWEKKMVQKQPGKRLNYQKKMPKRKNKASRIIAICSVIAVLCGIVPGIISLVADIVPDMLPENREVEYEYEHDPYAYLERDFQEGGESYSTILGTGEYVVGIHIPEGRYTLQGNDDDYSSVDVDDDRNSVWMYLSLNEDEATKEDVRLFLGARVSVETNKGVEFVSENAQTIQQSYMENPLTENVIVDQSSETAGVEFEAGVYDIVMTDGYGDIQVEILGAEENQLDSIYTWLDADSENKSIYRNVVFPEGAKITCHNDETQVMLVPSEQIVNTDYISYYTGEYLEQEPFATLLKEIEGEQ